MLKVKLDEDRGIAVLEPNGELSKEDFEFASELIDPYLESNKVLHGIIIHVQAFHGWDSCSSLVAHLKFVKEHHRKIARIAFVTDSVIGSIAEKIASHFVNAEVKCYAFSELETSRSWILGSSA